MKSAAFLSNRSRKRHSSRPESKIIPPAVYSKAARLLKKNGLETVIIGHYHQPRQELFHFAEQTKSLIMLGDWENDRSYLQLADGAFSFCNFRRSEPETA